MRTGLHIAYAGARILAKTNRSEGCLLAGLTACPRSAIYTTASAPNGTGHASHTACRAASKDRCLRRCSHQTTRRLCALTSSLAATRRAGVWWRAR